MRHLNKITIGLSEGLLPLLDISILLLGFFIILFAAGAFNQEDSGGGSQSSTDKSLPGISQVILIRVKSHDSIFVSSGPEAGSREVTDLDKLPEALSAIKQNRNEDKPVVLIYYENPWADHPQDLDRKIVKAVCDLSCRYSRIYP